MASYDGLLTLLLLGDVGVGKSSLLKRFVDQDFDRATRYTPASTSKSRLFVSVTAATAAKSN